MRRDEFVEESMTEMLPGDGPWRERRFTHPNFNGMVVKAVDRAERAVIDEAGDMDFEWTGQVVIVLVGDNTPFTVDPDDLVPYDQPVCSCGQKDCGWGW